MGVLQSTTTCGARYTRDYPAGDDETRSGSKAGEEGRGGSIRLELACGACVHTGAGQDHAGRRAWRHLHADAAVDPMPIPRRSPLSDPAAAVSPRVNSLETFLAAQHRAASSGCLGLVGSP
jgi:hypothetical protein